MDWDDTDVDDDVDLTEAELSHLQRLTDAEADGDDRAVEAALRPRPSTRWSARSAYATSWGWCSRPPGVVVARPTTSCSPVRPGSARPRWR